MQCSRVQVLPVKEYGAVNEINYTARPARETLYPVLSYRLETRLQRLEERVSSCEFRRRTEAGMGQSVMDL